MLDEPCVGLHARDNARLIEAQARLRDLGNTVIVVEHDREAILAADHVVDMGPGAGVHGGRDRRPGHARTSSWRTRQSITGPWLERQAGSCPSRRKRKARTQGASSASSARARTTCENVTAEIPLGLFTCVTGVCG